MLEMQVHWFIVELAAAYFCSNWLAPAVLPTIFLTWLLKWRDVWAEEVQSQQPRSVAPELVVLLGQYSVVLLLGVFDVDQLVALLDATPATVAFGWSLLCTELEIQAYALAPSTRERILVGAIAGFRSALSVALVDGSASLKARYVLLQAWFALARAPYALTLLKQGFPRGQLEASDAHVESTRGEQRQIEASEAQRQVPSRPPASSDQDVRDDDGSALIQVMAPQIILNMLSHSTEFVSALCEVNGTFRWVSSSVVPLWGYEQSDLIGTNGWDTVHPEDVERILKIPRDAGNRLRFTFRRRMKNGQYELHDNYGLYDEGFFFYQEQLHRPSPSMVLPDIAFKPLEVLVQILQTKIMSRERLSSESIELIVRAKDLIQGGKPEFVRSNVWECLDEIIHACTAARNLVNSRQKTRKAIHAEVKGCPRRTRESEKAQLFWPRDDLLVVVRALVEACLQQGSANALFVLVQAISWNERHFLLRFTYEGILEPKNMALFLTNTLADALKGYMSCNHLPRHGRDVIELILKLDAAEAHSEDTILVVDDDEMIHRVIKRRLPKIWEQTHLRPIRILSAKTSQDALDIISNEGQNLRLIAVDLNLGENSIQNGIDTLDAIAKSGVKGKLVLLTSAENIETKYRVLPKDEAIIDKLCSAIFT